MKLIELIIKHVPREKIHPDAKFFAQDDFQGDDRLGQFKNHPAANYNGRIGYWFEKEFITRNDLPELAEDARNTVVTREQLEYLWSLQDQGYTLAFGTEPMPSGVWYEMYHYTLSDGTVRPTHEKSEGVITAYRPVKNESRSPVKEFSVDANVETKKRLELFDKSCDGVWPGKDWEKFAVTVEGQVFRIEEDKIITRKMWDDYVSRKIRVGDKVRTEDGFVAEVLFMTEKSGFIRYDEDGMEASHPLRYLTRVSE